MRIKSILVASALSTVSAPAAAEVVTTGDGGFLSRNAVEVRGSPAEAWAALLEPRRWWNKAHTYSGDAANLSIEARAGGCFCEALPQAAAAGPASGAGSPTKVGGVEHMRVVLVQPGQVLRLTGGLGPLQSEPVAAVLTMTLKPVPGGTRILWEYVVGGTMRYKTAEIAPAVDKVMGEQLTRLAARLGPLDSKAARGMGPTRRPDRTAPLPERRGDRPALPEGR